MLGGAGETPYDLRFWLFGIPVRVHPIFWLTAAFLVWNGDRPDLTFIGVLCVFASVLVHEMGHALATKHFGWHPSIVLYFFGGYATTTRHSHLRNIVVLAAGPLAGLALFGLVLMGLHFLIRGGVTPNDYVLAAVRVLLFANLLWSLMNLIPVYPLDGGQIVREVLELQNPRDAMRLSLMSSIAAAIMVVGWCAICMRTDTGFLYGLQYAVFGAYGLIIGDLDPQFMGIMFAIFGIQNYQAYRANFGHSRW